MKINFAPVPVPLCLLSYLACTGELYLLKAPSCHVHAFEKDYFVCNKRTQFVTNIARLECIFSTLLFLHSTQKSCRAVIVETNSISATNGGLLSTAISQTNTLAVIYDFCYINC